MCVCAKVSVLYVSGDSHNITCVLEEKNKLLRKFIAHGQNCKACEAELIVEKEQSLEGKRVWKQLRVCDMPKPPYNFPQCPSCVPYLHAWSRRLNHKFPCSCLHQGTKSKGSLRKEEGKKMNTALTIFPLRDFGLWLTARRPSWRNPSYLVDAIKDICKPT